MTKNILPIVETFNNKASIKLCHTFGPHFAMRAEKLNKNSIKIPHWINVKINGNLVFQHIYNLNTKFYMIYHTSASDNLIRINHYLPTFMKDLFYAMEYIMK